MADPWTPFDLLPPGWPVWVVLAASAALALLVGRWTNPRVLRRPTRGGIVDLAMVGTADRARTLLEAWGPDGRARARSAVHWDFVLILAYGLLLGSLCALAAEWGRELTPGLGRWLVWAVVAAMIADVLENVGLLGMLRPDPAQSLGVWPRWAWAFAWVKFALAGAVVLLLIAGAAGRERVTDDLWATFVNGFCVSLVLPAVLVFVALVLANRVGRGIGLPLLLWVRGHSGRRGMRQFMIGAGVGVLVWQTLLAGYLSEEFVTSYTWDHPPFCEVRDPLDESALDHPEFPGRFRYLPTDVRALWHYGAVVLLAGAAVGVLLVVVVAALQQFVGRSGAPFARPWEAFRRSRDIPRPPYSVWLPLGIVAGLAGMSGVTWAAWETPTGQSITGAVGERLMGFGGWGKQSGRQGRLKAVINYREAARSPAGPAAAPGSDTLFDLGFSPPGPGEQVQLAEVQAARSELREMERTALARPTEEELRREYEAGRADVRGWLAPYAPVYGLFALTFLGILAFTVALANTARWHHLLSPAGWILLLLNLAVAASVVLSYFVPFNLQSVQLMLIGLAVLAGRSYKLRFPNLPFGHAPVRLTDAYDRMKAAETAAPAASAGHAQPTVAAAAAGPQKAALAHGPAGPKPPLALICASGGGSRAALWTMTVLKELEQAFLSPGGGRPAVAFPYHVRLATGASGGMLAAAAYTASLAEPPAGPPAVARFRPRGADRPLTIDDLVAASGRDFLDAIAHRLGTADLWNLFIPRRLQYDRGWAVEDAWREAFRGVLDQTFEDLRAGERDGWRPSLIFAPMLVEDGRQLFISNLGLRAVTRNLARMLGDPGDPAPQGGGRHLLSREGVEFFELFPDARATFQVGTAARMSASFPYVLPAAVLPTNPPRRVVDAGYYDNYGVGIAVSWLANHFDWVREHTSGVVLVQIRDGESEAGRRREAVVDSYPGLVDRGLQFATSPAEGLWQSRVASNVFRNDNLIHTLTELFQARGLPADFLVTATFEFVRGEDVSLSFVLTEEERKWVAEGAQQINGRVNAVVDWWHQRMNNP